MPDGEPAPMGVDEPERAPSYGVLTRRRLLTWGLVGLLFIAGIAFLVGHYGARKNTRHFDWELASVFGTALGTTLLALATGALAFTTSGDVRATWELARLTRQDQEQRERPVVLVEDAVPVSRRQDSVYDEDLPEQTGALLVNLRNVGLGPALRVEGKPHYRYDDLEVVVEPKIIPSIPAGRRMRVEIVLKFRAADWGDLKTDGFPVEGTYRNRAQTEEYLIISSWD
jgi:hypothetical protein